jgi:hypothetical protein
MSQAACINMSVSIFTPRTSKLKVTAKPHLGQNRAKFFGGYP